MQNGIFDGSFLYFNLLPNVYCFIALNEILANIFLKFAYYT